METTKPSTIEQQVIDCINEYMKLRSTFWLKDLNAHVYTHVNIGIHSGQWAIYKYIQKLVSAKKLSCINKNGNTKEYMVI